MKAIEISKRESSLIELCIAAKEASKAFSEQVQFTEQLAMLFCSMPTVTGEVG